MHRRSKDFLLLQMCAETRAHLSSRREGGSPWPGHEGTTWGRSPLSSCLHPDPHSILLLKPMLFQPIPMPIPCPRPTHSYLTEAHPLLSLFPSHSNVNTWSISSPCPCICQVHPLPIALSIPSPCPNPLHAHAMPAPFSQCPCHAYACVLPWSMPMPRLHHAHACAYSHLMPMFIFSPCHARVYVHPWPMSTLRSWPCPCPYFPQPTNPKAVPTPCPSPGSAAVSGLFPRRWGGQPHVRLSFQPGAPAPASHSCNLCVSLFLSVCNSERERASEARREGGGGGKL